MRGQDQGEFLSSRELEEQAVNQEAEMRENIEIMKTHKISLEPVYVRPISEETEWISFDLEAPNDFLVRQAVLFEIGVFGSVDGYIPSLFRKDAICLNNIGLYAGCYGIKIFYYNIDVFAVPQ